MGGLRAGSKVTHLWGQMHKQYGSYRPLSLAIALFRPVQGVGLENLQQPLLPVPESLVRPSLPGLHPFPALRGLRPPGPLPRPPAPSAQDGNLKEGTGLKHLARGLGVPGCPWPRTRVPGVTQTSRAEGTGGAGPCQWSPSTAGLQGPLPTPTGGRKVDVRARGGQEL